MLKHIDGIHDFLSTLPLFDGLEAEQVRRLAQDSAELDAPRGTLLYRRGDPCNGLYAVLAGQIKLALQSGRGDERVVELAHRGTTFGEAPLFCGQPHILTAQALVDSRIVHMPKELLISEVERDSRLAKRLINLLSSRLYQRLSEFEQYVLATGLERVATYLLHGHNGSASCVSDTVTLPANKGIIASRLNLTQEHFSRILRELMAEGLIEVDGREVRILNRQRLYGYTG